MVSPTGDASKVEVHVHTSRVPDGNQEVRGGIERTLALIKEQTEIAR